MIRQNPIQLKLLNAGYDQKDVAAMIYITPNTVSTTLRLKSHCYELQVKIAELVGEDPETLWGDHFAPVWRKNRASLHKQNTNA